MKRFSKIFCVALVAIILSSILTLGPTQPAMAVDLAANGVDKDLAQQLKNILDTKYPTPKAEILEACQLDNNVTPPLKKVRGDNVCTSYCVYTFLKDNDIALYDALISPQPGTSVGNILNKKIVEPLPYGYYNYDIHKYTTPDDTAEAARGYSYSTSVCSKKSGLTNIYNDVIWPGLTNIASTNDGTKINGYLNQLISNLGFGSPITCDTSETAFSVLKYELFSTSPFSIYTGAEGKEKTLCNNSTFGKVAAADKICLTALAKDLKDDKMSTTLNPGQSSDRANDIVSLANSLTAFANCPTATNLSAISSAQSATVTGVTENPDNSDCANDTPGGFLDCVQDIPLCFFKYINLGIIHSTASIIKMGVNTMGWLMQPNNLWAPGISNNPAVIQAFGASVSVVNIVFSIVLVMMAIGTILNLKNYKINDLITKFIIVALLINFTLVIAGSILDLANYISLYFYNATLKSIQSGTLTDAWTEILTNNVCLSGWAESIGIMFISIFINLLVFIAIAAAMLSVCGSLLKRGIMLMFLLIISPFAVICYLLPAKGMGQWWEKWKTSFLQQTFYGVYVSVGFYLGTIMLSALSISNQSGDIELSFASGLIKPVLAGGYLVFIVLLADEVAGGSAKASITGATKLALGVAGGAALAGAQQLKAAVTTSAPYENAMNTLSSSRLRAVRGLGQAGLAARDSSASYNEEHGKKIDADVTKRSDAVNRARIATLAGRTDGRSIREVAAAANQLYKTGHMDAATETTLHEHAGNLTNPDIERSGWLSRTTRNAYIRDNNPYMLAGDAFYRATGVTENELNASLQLNAQDLLDINPTVATIMGLRPGLNQGAIQNALNGYQRNIGDAIRRFGNCSDNLINTFFNPQNPNYNANLNLLVLGEICRNPASINAAMQLMTNNNAIEPGTINIAHDQIQAYLTANVGRYTPQQRTSINRPGYFNVV